VIPAAFDYVRPATLDEALAVLAERGEEAKALAGGHSLLPLMKLRLAQPPLVVDIGRLAELAGVRREGDELVVGALTRHADLERSELVRAELPLLAHAAGTIGDPQVRHRGTIGGALAHADPAGDLPAVLLALGGSVVARSVRGERVVPADELFTGFLETSLAPDELLTEVRLPLWPSAGWSFQKFIRRAQDWAIVGVAAVVQAGRAGVGLVNMGPTPLRARGVEEAVAAGASPAEAARRAAEGTDPSSDLHASADYRRHLAEVLVRRALEEATAPAAAR